MTMKKKTQIFLSGVLYQLPEGFYATETRAGGDEVYNTRGENVTRLIMDDAQGIGKVILGTPLDKGTVRLNPIIPDMVGVAEASALLEWRKQQVYVYMQRGKFPDPVQRLASGPIWTRKQIEDFKSTRQ